MKKTILVFSALIFALLALFQLSKYTYLSGDISIEIIIAVIAIVFFFIGAYLRGKTKKEMLETTEVNLKKIDELGITKREYEVLIQINNGLSNHEISEILFVSESTVKTHVSNLLLKLDAKRRTQALQKAKELQILPY